MGIIAGGLNVLPVFIQKSGLRSFSQSTVSSIRSRLFDIPKTSTFGRKSVELGPGFSLRKPNKVAEDRPYAELNDMPAN